MVHVSLMIPDPFEFRAMIFHPAVTAKKGHKVQPQSDTQK